jgi:transcriptional regulator with XRE-family HTH domain
MKIGEKIKKLRTAKLMTQSELAGSEITRNMLSRIENGAALPSLGTIIYIASRLNVSPGFLISEGSDEDIYYKYTEIINIKKAYMTEDYRICRDMCKRTESNGDDEIMMILAECNLEIAIEDFNHGKLRSACAYFDEAIEACTMTIYNTERIMAKVGAYFRYMHAISATLSSNSLDEEDINVYPALTDEFCRYMVVFCNSVESTYNTNDSFIFEKDRPCFIHLTAREQMKAGNYNDAYLNLHGILTDHELIPEPMLYFIFCELEICCREIGDFKSAYEYSNNKMSLLQSMLT